jgi:trehalose synthase
VAGNVGGIPLQITDGESGYLVSTPEECADRCVRVLTDPELGRRLGRAGKEHTRANFLTPRLLRDWLQLFGELRE